MTRLASADQTWGAFPERMSDFVLFPDHVVASVRARRASGADVGQEIWRGGVFRGQAP